MYHGTIVSWNVKPQKIFVKLHEVLLSWKKSQSKKKKRGAIANSAALFSLQSTRDRNLESMATTDKPVSQGNENDSQDEWSRIIHVVLSDRFNRRERHEAKNEENVDD